MCSTILNQIELLSCISVIVGAFAAVFFVVEYNGQLLLTGISRDLAGMALVIVCSLCTLASLRLMYNNFRGKDIMAALLLRF
jgi:TRAP-type C4-dicarboxylate transport system permease small subunit